jgi:hypothetical protein
MPAPEPFVLALLQTLSRPGDLRPVRLEGEVLLRSSAPLPFGSSLSPEGQKAKITYLARRLGLERISPEELASAWTAALADGRERSPRELLKAVRRPGRPDRVEDLQRRWRVAVEPMLAQVTLPAGMVETLGPAAPPEDLALRLELRPMLEEWPGRLLRDPWWSTAEAPLPDMRPLSLDDVWVDLQMLDPDEGPALAGRETLRGLLDQRFEERRWRAEPLALILERLSGVTAFVGPPGSGKTTLLKWIARQLVLRPEESRFLLPLYVPLRSYVLRKREGQEDSLLRCALRECGVRSRDQQRLWLHVLNEMTGLWRDRVLVLLDGWDEVPVEERPPLLDEVRDLAYGFSVLVTSRPAAFSSRLAASRVYEVADLPPDASDTLIRRWFRGVGAPEQADVLIRHLELHHDLRRLVRNPFLLTLLCGISHRTRRRDGVDLPTSRAALYRETLRLIYAQHDERYPDLPLDSERERQIERLALWLLDEAPGAPRFVFGPADVVASGADAELLPRYLQPSRLLDRLAPEEDSHHFLHATFQEYLAACSLEREPEKSDHWVRVRAQDAAFQEVFHFLAARPGGLRDVFWREMARWAAAPDRFGMVPARLARFVAAAGARDGGAALLGRDLRDLLWPLIERMARNRLWIEAYAELDAAGFVARATQAIQAADPRRKANLQRAVGRVRNPLASRALVDQILGDDPQAAAVASTQLHLRIDEEGLRRLRAAAVSPEVDAAVRRQAIQAQGYGRDGAALPSLLRIAESEPGLADEAVRAIGRIGGQEATAALAGLLGQGAEELGAVVVRALGEMREVASRDVLLDELARREAGDPFVVPLLNALSELPIHRGSELIVGLLASPEPETRRAAAWALVEATGAGVHEGLAAAARHDSDEDVRPAALEALERRATPDDSSWLVERIGDAARSADERGRALRALLTTAGRWSGTPEGEWLPVLAAEQVLLALVSTEGDLALEAVALAHHVGPSVAPRLIEVCIDGGTSPSVRELACTALGKMGYAGARGTLLSLVRSAPEAGDDEDQPLEAGADRVARAAAEALTRIDVASLLREPGTTAEHALARFAVETGALVFDSHVLGPDGREWARVPPPSKPEPAVRSRPAKGLRRRRDGLLAVDLQIEVSPHMFNGEQVLHYVVSSPSGAVHLDLREAQTKPFVGSLERYRASVVRRLERYQQRFHAADGLLLGKEVETELRALGHELYEQLFPPEMRLLYRQWREKVRTIQITSSEVWIPWELVRPYDHRISPEIDDDFLGARYQITRWLPTGVSPAPQIRVRRMACVEGGGGGPPLPVAEMEKRFVEDLADRRGVEIVSPRDAGFDNVLGVIERGEVDLLHFVGHGDYSSEDPQESKIFLVDGTSLRAGRLYGANLQKIWERRPLIFFNACSTGQQGWALTGPSGWVQAWIGSGGAGAFVAPQWLVRDSLAFELARMFYIALAKGRTLGRAARLARWWARRKDRQDSTWLAFAVYGHPNARVSFGPESGMSQEEGKTRAARDDEPVSRKREPARADLITSLRRNSDRARRSLDPYLLPRISRKEVHKKYLPAIRESVAQRRSRVIPILGSAGFGKSTLLGEIYDVLRSEDVSWAGLVDSAELSLSSPTDLPLALGWTLCDAQIPFDVLVAKLSHPGPGVLLIDTLDLVLSPAIVPHLQRLLFRLEDTATTVVFTCRDVDYQFQLEPPRLRLPQIADRIDRYMVPAFTPIEVAQAARAFVDTRIRLRGTLAGDAFVERLRSLSADSRSLQTITSNPLLLAMLCEVFGEGDLPRDLTVSELYDRYWDEKVARSRTHGPGDLVVIEKPRLCLRIAQHLANEWSELGQDWIVELDLGIEGSAAVAQARAELLSDGILKSLANGRIRFFHQTFLEYVMARWLTTGSGSAVLEEILGAARTGENLPLHWWPVLRQLLVLVEPADFAAIVSQLPLENPVAFRAVSFATVARAEPQLWKELLQRALVLGEEFQRILCVAAENAPARFLKETWSILEVLLRSGTRSVAISAMATVGTLLAREKSGLAGRLRKMLDALAARVRSSGDRAEDDTEITGQLLRACLPVLSATADPEVFELLQARYLSFASKGKGLIIDLFRSDAVEERQRAQFVRFLFAQPREKHLPAESLVALVEQTLRAEIPGENLTTAERLEILYRPVPEVWVSYHARAVARLFPSDPRLASEVARDHFSPQARSPHCDTSFLEELAILGQADGVCRALVEVPCETFPPGRMASLTTLSRELAQSAGIGPRQELAKWLQPLAVDRPEEVLEVFASLADACDETWNELVAALWAALESGDDRLAQRAVEGVPRRSLARLAPEIERLAGRYPGKTSLQHMRVAIYAPQVLTSPEAVLKLVELSLSHAKEVALAASLALARAVGEGARPRVAELLPLAESKIPGVRDHLMEAVTALQGAGCNILEDDLVGLCQRLAGETNAPTLQKLCTVAGTWVRAERRAILPLMQWAVGLTGRVESGRLEGGVAGALIRTLKVMAQLEDPQVTPLLQEAAHRMLRGVQHPNRLNVSESEITDLLSALARVDSEFLARLVNDGPNLPERNHRALAFTIRRVEGPGSPLLSLMLNSEWFSSYARNAILEFRGA